MKTSKIKEFFALTPKITKTREEWYEEYKTRFKDNSAKEVEAVLKLKEIEVDHLAKLNYEEVSENFRKGSLCLAVTAGGLFAHVIDLLSTTSKFSLAGTVGYYAFIATTLGSAVYFARKNTKILDEVSANIDDLEALDRVYNDKKFIEVVKQMEELEEIDDQVYSVNENLKFIEKVMNQLDARKIEDSNLEEEANEKGAEVVAENLLIMPKTLELTDEDYEQVDSIFIKKDEGDLNISEDEPQSHSDLIDDEEEFFLSSEGVNDGYCNSPLNDELEEEDSVSPEGLNDLETANLIKDKDEELFICEADNSYEQISATPSDEPATAEVAPADSLEEEEETEENTNKKIDRTCRGLPDKSVDSSEYDNMLEFLFGRQKADKEIFEVSWEKQ